MIWPFRHIANPATFPCFVRGAQSAPGIVPRWLSASKCPYCQTDLQTLREDIDWHRDEGGVDRERSTLVRWCSGCGWWYANRHDNATCPGYTERDHRQGWGALHSFNHAAANSLLGEIESNLDSETANVPKGIARTVEEVLGASNYKLKASANSVDKEWLLIFFNTNQSIGLKITPKIGRYEISLIRYIAGIDERKCLYLVGDGNTQSKDAKLDGQSFPMRAKSIESFLAALNIQKRDSYRDFAEFKKNVDLSNLLLRSHDLSH